MRLEELEQITGKQTPENKPIFEKWEKTKGRHFKPFVEMLRAVKQYTDGVCGNDPLKDALKAIEDIEP